MAIDSPGWMATGVRISTLSLSLLIWEAPPLSAQVNDQHNDANEARYGAMFGMHGYTPVPQDNVFATTPGLEQQIRRWQLTFSGLAPISFNSNAQLLPSGYSHSAEFSPIVGVSFATPVFDLPLRFTVNARAEVDRFTQAPGFDFDKIALSGRLQYVDANNDQAYSPYISYAPRWDFTPFYNSWFDTRQDLTFGINKTFNYDANFNRVAFSGNTLAETVWSFGVTAFFQRRFRYPTPSSWAQAFLPSMTYVISPQWNLGASVFLERRGFDSFNGFAQEDFLVEPIVTLEFVLPESWFGSAATATALGRPALDFQVAYEKTWSNLPGASFDAWHVGAALKVGWRF